MSAKPTTNFRNPQWAGSPSNPWLWCHVDLFPRVTSQEDSSKRFIKLSWRDRHENLIEMESHSHISVNPLLLKRLRCYPVMWEWSLRIISSQQTSMPWIAAHLGLSFGDNVYEFWKLELLGWIDHPAWWIQGFSWRKNNNCGWKLNSILEAQC